MAVSTTNAVRATLILALLAFCIAQSTAMASQRTFALGAQSAGAVTTISQADNADATLQQNQAIAVRRKGLPVVVFTDDAAVSRLLKTTQAEITSLKAGLAKDLAHGTFHAQQTQRAVSAHSPVATRSTAGRLLSARRELTELKAALRTDLANSDFRGPQTARELRKRSAAPAGSDEEALARGALSLSDDVWTLEMAIERDLHAKTFKAIETHFVIDGRRWKVG